MRCLTGSEIDRYVSGTMEKVVSEEVTKHLLACSGCRLAVSEARGNQGGVNTAQRTLDMEPEEEERPLVRIECDSCGARYGIPSDRIKGRVIKIRCKKCNDLIRIHNKDVQTEPMAGRGEGKVWFVVVRRKRIGPFSKQEVRQQFEQGKIKLRTYSWRQGYDQWERLGQIPEFADLTDPAATDAHQELFDEPTRQAQVGLEQLEDTGTVDSAVRTAYRPAVGISDSNVRTAYRPTDDDSEDGIQTAYRPANGDADSALQTAYRPRENVSESRRVTTYVPGEEQEVTDPGEAPDEDNGLTAIHYKDADPMAGLDGPEPDEDDLSGIFEQRPGDDQVTEDHFRQTPAAAASADYGQQDEGALEVRPEPAEIKPEKPSAESGAWDRRMRGQRHDESVLFSLNHLQNLADVKPEQRAAMTSGPIQAEDSGLFDIKPLAAAAAAPLVLAPAPSGGRRIGLGTVFLVGLLGMLVGAAVVVAVLVAARPQLLALVLGDGSVTVSTSNKRADDPVRGSGEAAAGEAAPGKVAAKKVDSTKKAPEPVATAVTPDAAPLASAATKTPDAGAAARSDLEAVAVAPDEPEPKAARSPGNKRKHRRRRRRRRKRGKRKEPPVVAALPEAAPREPAPAREDPGGGIAVVDPDTQVNPLGEAPAKKKRAAPAAPPTRSKKSKGSGDAELEELISAAEKGKVVPTKKGPVARPPPRAPAAPKKLTRTQVSRGMRRANPAMTVCKRRFQKVGVVRVRATISNDGKIGRATVKGSFAGTPVGECVLAAVRANCRFPSYSGQPVTVTYPFLLR